MLLWGGIGGGGEGYDWRHYFGMQTSPAADASLVGGCGGGGGVRLEALLWAADFSCCRCFFGGWVVGGGGGGGVRLEALPWAAGFSCYRCFFGGWVGGGGGTTGGTTLGLQTSPATDASLGGGGGGVVVVVVVVVVVTILLLQILLWGRTFFNATCATLENTFLLLQTQL